MLEDSLFQYKENRGISEIVCPISQKLSKPSKSYCQWWLKFPFSWHSLKVSVDSKTLENEWGLKSSLPLSRSQGKKKKKQKRCSEMSSSLLIKCFFHLFWFNDKILHLRVAIVTVREKCLVSIEFFWCPLQAMLDRKHEFSLEKSWR